jgi:hypothetical protein
MARFIESGLDAEIYIGDESPPPTDADTERMLSASEFWAEQPADDETKLAADEVVYQRTLAKWKDPTTPPHVKKECARWFRSKFPRIKTCVGWTLRYQWLYRVAELRVVAADQTDLKNAVEQCLIESAVVGVIAGIASGGNAAIAAAEIALKICLARKLAENAFTISIIVRSSRGDWE